MSAVVLGVTGIIVYLWQSRSIAVEAAGLDAAAEAGPKEIFEER